MEDGWMGVWVNGCIDGYVDEGWVKFMIELMNG
jgi:hypothetical protein